MLRNLRLGDALRSHNTRLVLAGRCASSSLCHPSCAGILDRQRAIILGAFTDCEPAAGMRYPYSLVEAIETLCEIAPCPVLTGFPFGHIPAKVTLPMGAPAEIAISGTQYTLSVRDYFSR